MKKFKKLALACICIAHFNTTILKAEIEPITKYSCNKDIQEYVYKNKNTLSTITRSQLMQYDINYQRAIYRSLSATVRMSLWQDKVQNVLSTANFNPTQILLINQLTSNFDTIYFDDDTTNDASFISFYNNFIVQARLSFTKQQYFQSFGHLGDYSGGIPYTPTGSTTDCGCSRKSDWCSAFTIGDDKCTEVSCYLKNSGCGTLWRFKCDGECTLLGETISGNNNNFY